LTEPSIKLYSVIIHYFEDSYAQRGLSDPLLVDEYFKMLESDDPEVRQQAADGLSNESVKNVFLRMENLLQLEKVIFDPNYIKYRRELLTTLDNIAKNSDGSNKRALEGMFREKLEELFSDRGEGSNVSEYARVLALSILSEVTDPSTRFQLLMECYLKLLEEGSDQAPATRSLIITKYPDRLTDFKLVLLKRFSSSTGEYRRRIGEELNQL
jgi:hypothetical protein